MIRPLKTGVLALLNAESMRQSGFGLILKALDEFARYIGERIPVDSKSQTLCVE